VGHTLLFVSLLAAQSQEVIYANDFRPSGSGCNCQQGQQVQQVQYYPQGSSGSMSTWNGSTGNGSTWNGSTWDGSMSERMERRPGLINRIRDMFGRGNSGGNVSSPSANANCNCHGYQSQPGMVGQAPMMLPQNASMPVSQPAAAQTREPDLAARPVTTAQFRPAPTAARVSKINPKFVNKTGHEEDYSWITGQIDREGNRWILRYATPETVDRFGGEIVLAPGLDMNNIHSGDLVSVSGQVMNAGSNSVQYRAGSIHTIERE
jgi:hypothetical protein